MAALGVTPSFLMNHVRLWGKVMRDDILRRRAPTCWTATRRWSKAGLRQLPLRLLRLADRTAELSPPRPHAPWPTGARCSNRRTGAGVPGGEGSTIDAAWMYHADGLVGSLTAGKAADFVLLADDPTAHEEDPDAVRGSACWQPILTASRCTPREGPSLGGVAESILTGRLEQTRVRARLLTHGLRHRS